MQYTRLHIICQYIAKYAIFACFLLVLITGRTNVLAAEKPSPRDAMHVALNEAIDIMTQKTKDAALAELLRRDPNLSDKEKKTVTDSLDYLRGVMEMRIAEACIAISADVNACPATSLIQIQAHITAVVIDAFEFAHAKAGNDMDAVGNITKAYLTRVIAKQKFEKYIKFFEDKNINATVNSYQVQVNTIVGVVDAKVKVGEKDIAAGEIALKKAKNSLFRWTGFLENGISEGIDKLRAGYTELAEGKKVLALITRLDMQMQWIKDSGDQLTKNMLIIKDAMQKTGLSPREIQTVFSKIDTLSIDMLIIQNSLDEISTILAQPEIAVALVKYNTEQRAKGLPTFDLKEIQGNVAKLQQSVNQDIKDNLVSLKSDETKEMLSALRGALAVDVDINTDIAFPERPSSSAHPSNQRPRSIFPVLLQDPKSEPKLEPNPDPISSPSVVTPPHSPQIQRPLTPVTPTNKPFAKPSEPMVVLGSYNKNTHRVEPYLYFRSFNELKDFVKVNGQVMQKNVIIDGVLRKMYYIQDVPARQQGASRGR